MLPFIAGEHKVALLDAVIQFLASLSSERHATSEEHKKDDATAPDVCPLAHFDIVYLDLSCNSLWRHIA